MVATKTMARNPKPGRQQSLKERRCIVSGQSGPVDRLIRFAVSPDGQLVPDVCEKLPGRGLWLSADRNVVNTAARKGLFSRAARCAVSVPDDLAAVVTALLVGRCQEIIGLSRRAGQAASGSAQVERALAKSGGGVLMVARDSGRDGRHRIGAVAKGRPIDDTLTAQELGEPFQRARVTHSFVATGPLSRILSRDLVRLAGMRDEASAQINDNLVVSENP